MSNGSAGVSFLPPEFKDVVEADRDGQFVVRLALILTLYFDRGHSADKRRAVLDCFNSYFELLGPELRWWVVDEGRFSPVAKLARKDMSPYLLSDKFEQFDRHWAFKWHGAEEPQEASDLLISALGQPKSDSEFHGDLSFLTMAVPLQWAAVHSDRFLDLAVRCATQLRPFHGYGGIGIVLSENGVADVAVEDRVASIAAQHPGVEIDSPMDHAIWTRNAIKGGNWITAVSDPFVEQLGGAEALRRSLGDPFQVVDYPGGVVIVAGPTPEFGDRNRRVGTPLYRKLARVLKPVRVTEHGGISESFEGRFDAEEFQNWLGRFDHD